MAQFETLKIAGHKAIRYFGSDAVAIQVKASTWQVYADATAETFVCVLRAKEVHGWMFRNATRVEEVAAVEVEDEAPAAAVAEDTQIAFAF